MISCLSEWPHTYARRARPGFGIGGGIGADLRLAPLRGRTESMRTDAMFAFLPDEPRSEDGN